MPKSWLRKEITSRLNLISLQEFTEVFMQVVKSFMMIKQKPLSSASMVSSGEHMSNSTLLLSTLKLGIKKQSMLQPSTLLIQTPQLDLNSYTIWRLAKLAWPQLSSTNLMNPPLWRQELTTLELSILPSQVDFLNMSKPPSQLD
jgi:hypothetical protein